jgi:hypothetical protein
MSYSTAHADSGTFSYLPCRHANSSSVLDGMAVYFALENLNNK